MIDTYTQEKKILYTFKTVIVGPPSAGKTCLFNRFCFNSFNFDTSLTIGVNFHSIDLKIYDSEKPAFEGRIINSIFDLGGNERFKALVPKFIQGADGALLVFDLLNKDSLAKLNFWNNLIMENSKGLHIPKLLVGTKRDLLLDVDRQIRVDNEMIEKFLRANKLDGYYQTSSLENYNVITVFKKLNELILKKYNPKYFIS